MGDNSITCVLVHMCIGSHMFHVCIPDKYEIIRCVGFPSKYLRGGEEWEKVDKMIDKEH